MSPQCAAEVRDDNQKPSSTCMVLHHTGGGSQLLCGSENVYEYDQCSCVSVHTGLSLWTVE